MTDGRRLSGPLRDRWVSAQGCCSPAAEAGGPGAEEAHAAARSTCPAPIHERIEELQRKKRDTLNEQRLAQEAEADLSFQPKVSKRSKVYTFFSEKWF